MDMTNHITIVDSCPNTFGEVYGPFLPKGWHKHHKIRPKEKPEVMGPPAPQKGEMVKPFKKKYLHVHKKRKNYKKRRRHK